MEKPKVRFEKRDDAESGEASGNVKQQIDELVAYIRGTKAELDQLHAAINIDALPEDQQEHVAELLRQQSVFNEQLQQYAKDIESNTGNLTD